MRASAISSSVESSVESVGLPAAPAPSLPQSRHIGDQYNFHLCTLEGHATVCVTRLDGSACSPSDLLRLTCAEDFPKLVEALMAFMRGVAALEPKARECFGDAIAQTQALTWRFVTED